MLPCSRVQQTLPLPLKEALITNPVTLGHLIHNRRVSLRLSQPELANQFGVSVHTLRSWETKGASPGKPHLPAIIQFVGSVPFQIDTTTLGGKVTLYRHLHGLTKKAFAAQVGIDLKTVRAIEKNQELFSKTVKKLEPLIASIKHILPAG